MEMTSDPYLVFGAPDIREEDIQEVVATLRSGWVGTGPKVARLEDMFREYTGATHAVAVSSCTAALHLSLIVAGLDPGDEVITTPLTFAATANAILHAGGRPVFQDVDRRTQNLDPRLVRRFLEEDCLPDPETGIPVNRATKRRVRALVPVHMCGRPCEMEELIAIAREHRLFLVEDAAHALGAHYRGKPIGSIGDLSCFSLYVTKNVTTVEGGMVTTDDPEVAARLKTYALHGLSADAWARYSDQGFKHYEVEVPGFKYNLTDLQASLGLHQFDRLEEIQNRRRTLWERYDEAFANLPVHTPPPPAEDTRHAYHLYTLMVDPQESGVDRDTFQRRLHEKGIGSGVHYRALHVHSYYQKTMNHPPGSFPEAEWITDRTVSIPLGSNLADQDVERVITAVTEALGS
jgi:dTDP-4-amino-4,6-dideoxygalactose transaminase